MSDLMQKKKKVNMLNDWDVHSGKQIEDYIDNFQDTYTFNYDGEKYTAYYETEQSKEQTQAILTSDEALVNYYKNTDPKMLDGLKSKSFFNFPGKKSEKKRLRRHYVDSKTFEGRSYMLGDKIDEYRDKNKGSNKSDEEIISEIRKDQVAAISGYYATYESYSMEKTEKLMYKVYNMDPLKRGRFYDIIQREKERQVNDRVNSAQYKELQIFTEQVKMNQDRRESVERNFLYSVKEEERKKFCNDLMESEEYKKIKDADLYGNDSKEVQELQTRIAQVHDPGLDYKAYRQVRSLKQQSAKFDMPDNVKEDMSKTDHKYDKTDYMRVCRDFMLPVEYVEKDGKQEPASMKDKENLAYNEKWGKSLLSDKEKEWEFRFQEMEKCIDSYYTQYIDEVKSVMKNYDPVNGTINVDEWSPELKMNEYRENGGRILCVSGVGRLKEQNNLFHSKYYKEMSEERRIELENRHTIVYQFLNLAKTTIALKTGADVDKEDFASSNKNGHQQMINTFAQMIDLQMKQMGV